MSWGQIVSRYKTDNSLQTHTEWPVAMGDRCQAGQSFRFAKKPPALWESLKHWLDEIKGKTLNVQQPHCTMFTILQDNLQLQNLHSLIIPHVQPSWNHYYYFHVSLIKYKLYISLSTNTHSALTFSITVNFFVQLVENAATTKSSLPPHLKPMDALKTSGIWGQLCQLPVSLANSINAHFSSNILWKPHQY